MVAQYKTRRDYLVKELNTIPGFHCRVPQGTFYALPRVDYQGMDSNKLSEFILEKAQVLLTPGSAYGFWQRQSRRRTDLGDEYQ